MAMHDEPGGLAHADRTPTPTRYDPDMSEAIEDAKRRLVRQVMRLPGVTAVGIGEADGAPCLRVWVVEHSNELRDAIPDRVAGYPVEVEASGPIRALDEEG